MFGHIRTRLAILYAGLFALALGLVAVALYVVIAATSQHQVRNELVASATVFDRLLELRLYAREQARSVHFDRPGIVPLGCNIHDNMIAFIDVVDTAFAARTDASGQARFTAIPGSQVLVRIWHPYLRAPANQLELRVAVPDHGTATQPAAVNLRPPPRPGSVY